MRNTTLFLLVIVSFVHCFPCPDGYTQGPDNGYCYKILSYYNSFATQFMPKTFDEVEADCNAAGGGLLASIHSQDENEFVQSLLLAAKYCEKTSETLYTNIGLRCVGLDCKWDDGSPVTYTNFDAKYGPKDDGVTRCSAFYSGPGWESKGCGKFVSDCWACSVKELAIECLDGETSYKGGCVSVHTSPLDQKSAETSCPGGGQLVSIHGEKENSFYTQLALKGGATGTIYIGGEYSNGKFEWTDGSLLNPVYWATGFPNFVFGSCMQMLLASEFGVKGQWTNIDCSVKQSYICIRDGLGAPKADSDCPPIQYFTASGSIYSPNYPLSIPNQQICEYILTTKEGTWASIKFQAFNCQSGATLSLFDGVDNDLPFATFASNSPHLNQAYTATSNIMRITFSANGTSTPIGLGWEAEFTGK